VSRIRRVREGLLDRLLDIENWIHRVRLLCKPLMEVEAYDVSPPKATGRLTAGAGSVDITPPPGFPMGGSSITAKFGRGYWTRLYARAFFFRDASGQGVAFVSCDLNAIPSGLHARVGSLLSKRSQDGSTLNLSPENLIVAATHVHHGPGNFFSYKAYNDHGSPEAGYDEELFHWLADQIKTAVVKAAQDAQGVAPEMETRLLLKQGKASGLLRNRSPEPFLLNADREEVIRAGPPAPPVGDCPEPFAVHCPRYRAVDESLTVLEVHRGGKHRASLVFLSVHPTAMSHETALYQSDFTGLAMTKLEKRDKIVAGFFNGADGDISVRWKRQNRNETVHFADRLVEAIDKLSDSRPLDPDLRILVARTEVPANPYRGRKFAGWSPPVRPGRPALRLAAMPFYGAAAMGGAEDARTPLFDLGWKPGVRSHPRDGQGVKVGAFESVLLPGINLTTFIAPSCYYPESFSVSLVSLRGKGTAMSFSVLPGELTRTMWWRLRNDLENLESGSLGHVVPIGLANDYIGYVTTAEEYAAQAYEGASVIFGPSTGDVLRELSRDLAANLQPPIPFRRKVDKKCFYPDWEKKCFGPELLGVAYNDPDEGLEPLIVDDKDEPDRHWKDVPYRHWPRFEWAEPEIDRSLSDVCKRRAGMEATEKRCICIIRDVTYEVLENESEGNLLTVYLNPPAGDSDARRLLRPAHPKYVLRGLRSMSVEEKKPVKKAAPRWAAIWLWPRTASRTERFRFKVKFGKESPICSEPFTIQEVDDGRSPTIGPDACPPEAVPA
jgi:neutral ceramidase